jgi:hypothetical protein
MAMRGAVLVLMLAAACVQTPSMLRSADLSGVTKIALVARSGSVSAGAALEEELKAELPGGHRFQLVTNPSEADAALTIDAQRWWIDERDVTSSPLLRLPALVRRIETMEATFRLAYGPNAVAETYRRSSSGPPRSPEATLWNDDLTAANAVQIVAAFLGDLSFDEQGALRPARPATPASPAETPVPL